MGEEVGHEVVEIGGRNRLAENLGHQRDALKKRRLIATLWAISLGGPVESTSEFNPVLETAPREPEERAHRLRWKWPGVEWNVIVDPLESR